MTMASRFVTSEDELVRLVQEKYINEHRPNYISYNGVFLPENFRKFADKIENFEVREDDIWVCSFPKTGTTWTQEMVWCLANDLDFETAKVSLPERFPYLEYSIFFDYTNKMAQTSEAKKIPERILDSVNFVNKLPSPRFIKSHLPFTLLPKQIKTGEKKPKIIYVNRNVKDTCISYFYHCQDLLGFRFTFEELCSLFLGGKVIYGPFWKHLLEFWERRNQENVLFLKYEDMKADLQSVIRETSRFLGKEILTENEMEIIEKHLSFEKMRDNPAVNYEVELSQTIDGYKNTEEKGKFMRSGKVYQWKEKMSTEMINRFDSWTEESLKDTGFVI